MPRRPGQRGLTGSTVMRRPTGPIPRWFVPTVCVVIAAIIIGGVVWAIASTKDPPSAATGTTQVRQSTTTAGAESPPTSHAPPRARTGAELATVGYIKPLIQSAAVARALLERERTLVTNNCSLARSSLSVFAAIERERDRELQASTTAPVASRRTGKVVDLFTQMIQEDFQEVQGYQSWARSLISLPGGCRGVAPPTQAGRISELFALTRIVPARSRFVSAYVTVMRELHAPPTPTGGL
jgi:hypothetical protein